MNLRQVKNISVILAVSFFITNMSYAWHWGRVELKPILNVREDYDSNITNANQNELSDFITYFKAGLEGTYEGPKDNLQFVTHLQEAIFANHDEFTNFSQDFSGTYKREISEYDHLIVTDKFRHAQEPRSFEDDFGRSSGRYDYYLNNFNSTYTHDVTQQLSLKLNYTGAYYAPSRTDLENSVQYKPGVEADYMFNSQNIGSVYYDFTRRIYERSGKITKNTTGVGYRRFLTSQLYADFKIGVDHIHPINAESYVKPRYFVGLTNQKNERTQYGLSYTKEFADNDYSQNIFDSWKLTLFSQKELLERLSLNLNFFTGQGKYEGLGTKQSFNGVSTGLVYSVTRNTDVTLGYSFSKSTSNNSSLAYTKNLVSLSLNMKF